MNFISFGKEEAHRKTNNFIGIKYRAFAVAFLKFFIR